MTALFNVFKYYNLGYVGSKFTMINFRIVAFILFSYIKYCVGLRANRTESWFYSFMLILACLVCGFLNLFFMFLQTYVMIYEVVIHGISIIFTGMEALFAFC